MNWPPHYVSVLQLHNMDTLRQAHNLQEFPKCNLFPQCLFHSFCHSLNVDHVTKEGWSEFIRYHSPSTGLPKWTEVLYALICTNVPFWGDSLSAWSISGSSELLPWVAANMFLQWWPLSLIFLLLSLPRRAVLATELILSERHLWGLKEECRTVKTGIEKKKHWVQVVGQRHR